MIIYKVIGDDRYGVNAQIIQYSGQNLSRFLETYPKMKKFFPLYEKGKIISSPKNSVGLCCFKRKKDAKNFIDCELDSLSYKLKIVSVQVIERIEKSESEMILLSGCGMYPLKILSYKYFVKDEMHVREIPDGTIFVKKLKVLE